MFDAEYPSRAAFAILRKLVTDPGISRSAGKSASKTALLVTALERYQDPCEADQILRIMGELDVTKTLLHKSMDSLLKRGEKMDDMVRDSQRLSATSKSFYVGAKKTNSCCVTV